MPNNIIRLPAVKQRTGLPRSSIYYKMAKGQFPKPISIGERSVGWIESEVQQWIDDQVKHSRHIDA